MQWRSRSIYTLCKRMSILHRIILVNNPLSIVSHHCLCISIYKIFHTNISIPNINIQKIQFQRRDFIETKSIHCRSRWLTPVVMIWHLLFGGGMVELVSTHKMLCKRLLTFLYVQLSQLRTTRAITWSTLLLELRVDM